MEQTRIIVTHYGGPDALRIVHEECPAPKAGEVQVRVLRAGVSSPDVMAREGIHPETPQVPFTPGWDLVDFVDQLGEGLSGIEQVREDLIALLDLLKQQEIKPLISKRFHFADVRQGHETLEKGGVVGKIVLAPEFAKAEPDFRGSRGIAGQI